MKIYQNIICLFLVFTFCSCYAQVEQIKFPQETSNKKTKEHKRIKGSRIFIKYPDSYNYQINLTRIQKKEQQYLQFTETTSLNFTEVKKKNYSKSALEQKGINYEDIQHIQIQNYEGIFSIGSSKDPTEEKIVMSFGDESFYVIIGGVINKNNKEGKIELIEILKTIYFEKEYILDPMELVNFEVDLDITNFTHTDKISNIHIFSKDSIDLSNEDDDLTINNFMVASLPKIDIPDLKYFAKDMLFRMELRDVFLIIENKNLKEEVINGNEVIVLESKLNLEGKEGILYLVAINGPDSGIFFLGTAFKDPEKMEKLYKETVAKMKFKENY